MKNFKNYLAFLAVFALLFTSCSKDEPGMQNEPSDNVASLTFSSVLADFNKSQAKQQMDDYPECQDLVPTHAQISLVYGDANVPVNVQVGISQDADGFFTLYDDDLEIPVPNGEDWVDVTLLDFDVYNNNTLLWTAPQDGSQFATFVADALPMNFQLRAGSKNYQDVEVLCFDNRVVNRYGYQFFNIVPEELRQLCFFVNYCSDEGRHYTADYDLNVYYYTGNDVEEVTWADLELVYNGSPIQGDDGAFYTDPLCFAIPEPQLGEGGDQPYLYYEVTLAEWNDNYDYQEDVASTGFLTWNDIVDLLDTDDDGNWQGTDADYYHVQLNCGVDDGPGPIVGQPGNGVDIDPCEMDVPSDTTCTVALLEGTDDFVAVPDANLPFEIRLDGNRLGEVTLVVGNDGNINLTSSLSATAGYVYSAYEIWISSSTSEDDLVAVRCSDVSPSGALDIDVGDLQAEYDDLYIRMRAYVCPANE